MYPILISIGPVVIFNFSIFLVLSWLVFSFIFWQKMRNYGIEDEKIFDLTFYTTITAAISSRLFYILTNLSVFSDNLLKIFAVWVFPGLSLYGAIIGTTVSAVLLVKKYKIRISYLLDSLGFAFAYSLIICSIGSLLDGTIIGKLSNLPIAIQYLGHAGKRHPVQIYDILSLILILVILHIIQKKSIKNKWPYGLIGIWFFLLFAVSQFVLEFFKESNIYLGSLTLRQWIHIAIASESLGAIYIKIGGKQKIIKLYNQVILFVNNIKKEIYAKFSKRLSRKGQNPA